VAPLKAYVGTYITVYYIYFDSVLLRMFIVLVSTLFRLVL